MRPRRIAIAVEDHDLGYFEACARIRDIDTRSLFRRVLKTIASDQLVASILDDETELRRRRPGDHRYRTSV